LSHFSLTISPIFSREVNGERKFSSTLLLFISNDACYDDNRKKVDTCCSVNGQKGTFSMHKKCFACSFLCLFILVVLSGCGGGASYGTAQHPVGKVQQASAKPIPITHAVDASPTVALVDQPVRLIIPAIHLDAAIEVVGLKADGDLDTPQEHPLDDVGWYNMGPQPGARGSAVIDGHLDRPGGEPAVFWYLNNLHNDDDVMVISSQGRTLHFRVTRMQAYQPQDAPLQAIFGDMSGNYLNLITCAGYWVSSQHQTTQRLVVYTSLVDPLP
jgi:sortase (surface protein transpeptidase)